MGDRPDLAALFGAQEVHTFLGLPACTDLAQLEAPIALAGVPGATPYSSVGAYCAGGPAALRRATAPLAANLGRINFDLGRRTFPGSQALPVDCGDLPYDPSDFAANRNTIQTFVASVRARNAVPLLIGGDDSIPIPMLQALDSEGPLTIVQIDAHIDWRDSHMGERLGLSSPMRRASEMPHIAQILQIGARSIGSAAPEDLIAAQNWGAHILTARDLHRNGADALLASIPNDAPIALCFDVDALDSSINPAVIGRAPGGLNYHQALDLIDTVSQRGRIVTACFTEFMPDRDIDGLGALTVSNLITATLGLLCRDT